MTGAWLETAIKVALLLYAAYRIARAMAAESSPPPRVVLLYPQSKARYTLFLSLRAFYPRLTAEQLEAIVNRRFQEGTAQPAPGDRPTE